MFKPSENIFFFFPLQLYKLMLLRFLELPDVYYFSLQVSRLQRYRKEFRNSLMHEKHVVREVWESFKVSFFEEWADQSCLQLPPHPPNTNQPNDLQFTELRLQRLIMNQKEKLPQILLCIFQETGLIWNKSGTGGVRKHREQVCLMFTLIYTSLRRQTPKTSLCMDQESVVSLEMSPSCLHPAARSHCHRIPDRSTCARWKLLFCPWQAQVVPLRVIT